MNKDTTEPQRVPTFAKIRILEKTADVLQRVASAAVGRPAATLVATCVGIVIILDLYDTVLGRGVKEECS